MKEKIFEDIDLSRLVVAAARMSMILDSDGMMGADNDLAVITPTNIPEYAKTHIIWLDKPGPASKNLKRRANKLVVTGGGGVRLGGVLNSDE